MKDKIKENHIKRFKIKIAIKRINIKIKIKNKSEDNNKFSI
jgi:hypothetical protein